VTIAQRQNQIVSAAANPREHGTTYFVAVLESESDPLCRWHAVKAIGDLKAIEAKGSLFSVLQQPDHEFDESSLHRICAWAIGRIGCALISDVINALEATPCKETRVALIDALGEIGDPAGIPALSRELVSPDMQVRLWAALSLAKIGEESLPSFSCALKEADASLVFIVVDALTIIGTERTVPLLVQAFEKDPHAVAKYFSKSPTERTARYASVVQQSQILSPAHELWQIADRYAHLPI
jgi:HEAT repeat protein